MITIFVAWVIHVVIIIYVIQTFTMRPLGYERVCLPLCKMADYYDRYHIMINAVLLSIWTRPSVINVNKYITENKYPVIYNHSWD